MGQATHRLMATTAKYTDNRTGKERSMKRQVGEVFYHSDGQMYISLDPYFNLSALERKPGRDRVFLTCEAIAGGNGDR